MDRVISEFRALVEAAIEDEAMKTVQTPSADYAAYMRRCGHVSGLARSLKLLEEAQEKVSVREPAQKPKPSRIGGYES